MSADNLQVQIERHIEALDKSVHAYLTHIVKTELLAHTPLWASYIIFTFRAEMNAIIIEADEIGENNRTRRVSLAEHLTAQTEAFLRTHLSTLDSIGDKYVFMINDIKAETEKPL